MFREPCLRLWVPENQLGGSEDATKRRNGVSLQRKPGRDMRNEVKGSPETLIQGHTAGRGEINAASVSRKYLVRAHGWERRYGLDTEESDKDSVKLFQTLDKKWKAEAVL